MLNDYIVTLMYEVCSRNDAEAIEAALSGNLVPT